MKNRKFFWFFLEPYTFVFSEPSKRVIYNTLNGSYLTYEDPFVCNILDRLNQPENGYCIEIENSFFKRKSFLSLIREVRQSFTGDVLPVGDIAVKPFIFVPLLRLYNNVERIKKERDQSLGELILRNLNQVTCFLPGSCTNKCTFCDQYYKQFPHCTNGGGESLSLEEYFLLFDKLEAAGVSQVNLIINGGVSFHLVQALCEHLTGRSFKKTFYINIRNLHNFISVLNIPEAKICVSVDNLIHITQWAEYQEMYRNFPVAWEYVIRDIHEIENIESVLEEENVLLKPFYDGSNFTFFKENIYIQKEEILQEPISIQRIFRRQVVNENFFGQLFILSTGEVYSNLNLHSLGNIKIDSLGEIVYREMEDSHAWLKVRSEGNCRTCINKYLCPSPSNYEFVLNKTDLCYLAE